jgi:hypothetical protein
MQPNKIREMVDNQGYAQFSVCDKSVSCSSLEETCGGECIVV